VLCALAIVGASTGFAALFHAALLRSTPAAGAKLDAPPREIRLLFSEEVVPSLSQITLIGPLDDSTTLRVSNDPHDVHALVGVVPPAKGPMGGAYKVYWRVISADGHPVDGEISFTVAGPVATAPTTAVPVESTLVRSIAEEDKRRTEELPVLAASLRGIGLAALMAAVGLLFFGATARDVNIAPSSKTVILLTAVGAVFLVAHLAAWLYHITPAFASYQSFASTALRSKLGRVELLRSVLAVVMLVCVFASRNGRFALGFGVACLIVSGAVGHSAAIHPLWATPAKSIHLLAGGIWLGGLLWILRTAPIERDIQQREVMRVSAMALVSVIAILATGLLQSWFFLNSVSDLVHSSYGRLVMAKMVGLLVLIGYGVYNRFSLLPAFAVGGSVKLRKSVKQEIFLISVLALIGGFLAYVPPPPSRQSTTPVARGGE
jgi:copper transport protein